MPTAMHQDNIGHTPSCYRSIFSRRDQTHNLRDPDWVRVNC
jgi:hypothetical protein